MRHCRCFVVVARWNPTTDRLQVDLVPSGRRLFLRQFNKEADTLIGVSIMGDGAVTIQSNNERLAKEYLAGLCYDIPPMYLKADAFKLEREECLQGKGEVFEWAKIVWRTVEAEKLHGMKVRNTVEFWGRAPAAEGDPWYKQVQLGRQKDEAAAEASSLQVLCKDLELKVTQLEEQLLRVRGLRLADNKMVKTLSSWLGVSLRGCLFTWRERMRWEREVKLRMLWEEEVSRRVEMQQKVDQLEVSLHDAQAEASGHVEECQTLRSACEQAQRELESERLHHEHELSRWTQTAITRTSADEASQVVVPAAEYDQFQRWLLTKTLQEGATEAPPPPTPISPSLHARRRKMARRLQGFIRGKADRVEVERKRRENAARRAALGIEHEVPAVFERQMDDWVTTEPQLEADWLQWHKTGAVQPQSEPSSPKKEAPPSPTSPSKRREPWECPRCGTKNKVHLAACDMCDCPRPRS